jgi:hypothetical protein
VHDVAGAHDYLRVHQALARGADDALALAPELRREGGVGMARQGLRREAV